jgi:hypothetical protein
MPSIKVSQDLYMALERRREPQDKRMTDLLWRLVEERGIKRTEPTSMEQGWWHVGDAAEGLSGSDITIPNGATLRGRYRGKYFQASVQGGRIVMDGEKYESPSAAARAVLARQRVVGAAASVNGWRFWEMEYPAGSGQWRRLDSFRKPWQVKRRRP